jgi:hypothetical protein
MWKVAVSTVLVMCLSALGTMTYAYLAGDHIDRADMQQVLAQFITGTHETPSLKETAIGARTPAAENSIRFATSASSALSAPQ